MFVSPKVLVELWIQAFAKEGRGKKGLVVGVWLCGATRFDVAMMNLQKRMRMKILSKSRVFES